MKQLLVILCTWLVGQQAILQATTYTWTGAAGNGDWNHTNNWTPVGIPAGTDTVNVTNGSIKLEPPVTHAGVINWSGGQLGDRTSSRLTIGPGGTLNIYGGGTKVLYGMLTNAGTMVLVADQAQIDLGSSGRLVNLPGALVDIQGDNDIVYTGYSGGVVDNRGTFRKSGGTNVTEVSFFFTFLNSGTVEAWTGTVNIGLGATVGHCLAAPGANVQWTHTTVHGGATFAGDCRLHGGNYYSTKSSLEPGMVANLQLASGTINVADGVTLSNAPISGATLNLAGKVTMLNGLMTAGGLTSTNGQFSGMLEWRGGDLSGQLTVGADGVLVATGVGDRRIYALTNYGTIVLNDAVNLYLHEWGASLINGPSGVIDLKGNNNVTHYGYTTYLLENHGLLRKSGGTNSTIQWTGKTFINSGRVEALSGTLNIHAGRWGSAGSGETSGQSFAAPGAVLEWSGTTIRSGATFAGDCRLRGGSYESIVEPGLLANVQMVSGSIVLMDGVTLSNAPITGATLNLAGNLTMVNGLMTGGTFGGTNGVLHGGLDFQGSSLLASGARLTVAQDSTLLFRSGGRQYLNAMLTNRGTMVVVSGQGYLDLGGSILVNLPGALLDIQGDNDFGSGGGRIENQGTFRKSGGTNVTELWSPLTFFNSGTVEALSGTIRMDARFTDLGGILAVRIEGPTNFSRIQFTRALAVQGGFKVSVSGGYTPAAGDSFPVITYPSISGSFTSFAGLTSGGGLRLVPRQGKTEFRLAVEAYTVTVPPVITLNRAGNTPLFWWPPEQADYQLLMKTNLTDAEWTLLPGPWPDGYVPPSGQPHGFYRLVK